MSLVINIPQDPSSSITIGVTPVVGGTSAAWAILHLNINGTLINADGRFIYNEDTHVVTLQGTMVASLFTNNTGNVFPSLILGNYGNSPYTTAYIASATNDGAAPLTLEMDTAEFTQPFILGQFNNGNQSWKINHDGSFDWTHLNDFGSGSAPVFYIVEDGGFPGNTTTIKGWMRINNTGADWFIPLYS